MSELFDRFSEAYKALERRDVSKMADLFADDIVFITPERTMKGKEEAISRFVANQNAFSDLKLEVDPEHGVIDAGDCCAVEFIITGTLKGDLDTTVSINDGTVGDTVKATGKKFRMRSTDHVWWRDGKIYKFSVYYDPAEPTRQIV
ncbi:Ketosteroid isomerase-related protein [Pseudonocardia thermophila]|jgi:Ketosteroid isomerase-related protein|uniref:Ketosteroid isomerase-related protein n=1 Tax=Pseudonocardia thermophila TaxID=1848 RepID=A0A1M6P4X3_PSETH|nr:nuclear transport factor 2 family protein [Pseudonocardia thermophila]SHK02960.1 Ketosteroid isomerase-related protein [Pseudonocardia thermophila]